MASDDGTKGYLIFEDFLAVFLVTFLVIFLTAFLGDFLTVFFVVAFFFGILVTDFLEKIVWGNKKRIFTKNKTRSGSIKVPLGLLACGASG